MRATTLDIRGSSGSIGGAGLDANEAMIEDKRQGGRRTKEPATDYDIGEFSTSGRVDAPSGTIGVGKRIVVRTTSGSIDLDFNVEAAPDSGARRGNDGASSDGSSPLAPGAPAAPVQRLLPRREAQDGSVSPPGAKASGRAILHFHRRRARRERPP